MTILRRSILGSFLFPFVPFIGEAEAQPTGTNTEPSLAPANAAAGDLSGSYPNPVVTKTNGVAFGPAATAVVGAIPGTATNDNAPAGDVGEFTSGSLASTSALALTSTVGTMVCSAALSAGDWDVWGQAFLKSGLLATVTVLTAAVSSTAGSSAAGLPTLITGNAAQLAFGAVGIQAASDISLLAGPARFTLAAAGTAFVNAVGTFTSTASAYGVIQARRRR